MFNTRRLLSHFALDSGMRLGVFGISLSLSLLGSAGVAWARPAEVFHAHLDRLRSELPHNYVMRLPSEILLGGPGMEPEAMQNLIVKILPTNAPPQIIVNLQTCEAQPHPCLIGSFAVARADSPAAQTELAQHQERSTPITLAPNVQAFLVEQQPSGLPTPLDTQYASVMWQQDGMIYTVRFPAAERQNMLYMARSMAIQPPILPEQTASSQ